MIKFIRVWIILGWLIGHSVLALEVNGLYEVEVVARSQEALHRDQAIQTALKLVLGRIMAGRELLQDSSVQLVLARANDYVREYQFSLTGITSEKNSQARLMRVLFDERKLQAILKNSQLGIWNEIRPETLLWLVVEEHGKRLFFNPEKMPEINDAVRQMSKLQGVPLLLPLMDIEEQSMLSVAEVLSPYPHPLLDISERYDTVSILVGLVVNRSGCWSGEWAHYFDQGIQQWQGQCKPLKQAVMDGMRGTYLQLAQFYAVKPEMLDKRSLPLKLQ